MQHDHAAEAVIDLGAVTAVTKGSVNGIPDTGGQPEPLAGIADD